MRDCIADSFRRGALEQVVASRPKIALYTNLAQYDQTLEKYTTENESRGDGYQPGGYLLEGGVVIETPLGFVLLFHSPVWQNATIKARGAVLYLADDANRVIRLIDFGKDIVSTNGPFTVKFPGAADGGVIRI
jgi:hypothetical protein